MRIIVILLTFILVCFADTLYVIANDNFPLGSLGKKQVKKIFLKQIDYIHSMPIYPVNLPSTHLSRKLFRRSVLNMQEEEVKEYWIRAHYEGKRAPLVQKSQRGVLEFVKQVDGSVGYVRTDVPPEDVKILYKAQIQ